MRARETGGKWLILYSILATGTLVLGTASANSATLDHSHPTRIAPTVHYSSNRNTTSLHFRHSSISCVPFARAESGIEVSGNAWQWWENAAGIYERGDTPQLGSVLVFQANRHMRLGHVAVVTHVYNSREIEVDQANWPHGSVQRGVSVVDVSPLNDWTAVRVEIGHGGKYGSIYPTYGFIYDRPDRGRFVTAAAMGRRPVPIPLMNPAPTDLRQVALDEELAEAPAGPSRRHRVR